MLRDELVRHLDETLEAARFKDYCPNGLQVEGRAEIRRVVTGVSASQALLDRAVETSADAVLVHHGYFWKGEDARVLGMRQRRLKTLLKHDINLIAYHLPLDAHPELGNNAGLGKSCGWRTEGRFLEQEIGFYGTPAYEVSLAEFAGNLTQVLGRAPLTIGATTQRIRRIAWCTGAAQGYIEQASALAVDAYVSGEISEQTVHVAREAGIAYLAIGHHASERFGVQALARHLSKNFGTDAEFIDIENPV